MREKKFNSPHYKKNNHAENSCRFRLGVQCKTYKKFGN